MPDFTHDGRPRFDSDLLRFSECSTQQLRRIRSLSTRADVSPGRTLCAHGKPGHEFFVIVDGEATVTIDGTDVATLGPGCGFGEVRVAHWEGRPGPRPSPAATAMNLLVFNRVEFATLLEIIPIVARGVLQASTSRLAATAQSRHVSSEPPNATCRSGVKPVPSNAGRRPVEAPGASSNRIVVRSTERGGGTP